MTELEKTRTDLARAYNRLNKMPLTESTDFIGNLIGAAIREIDQEQIVLGLSNRIIHQLQKRESPHVSDADREKILIEKIFGKQITPA